MANLYYEREDVLEFLSEYEHKDLYIYISKGFARLTNNGDLEDGRNDEKYFESIVEEASEKYSLSLLEIYRIYDEIDKDVRTFMLDKK